MTIEFNRQCASRLFSGMVFGGLLVYTLSSTRTISGVTLGLIIASIGWVGNLVLRKNRIERTHLAVLALLFLSTIAISAVRSGKIVMGLDMLRSHASKVLLYYIVISEILSERNLRRLARGLMIGALIAGVYELGMVALDTSRLEGLATNRALGGMFGMLIPFSVSFLLVESERKWRSIVAVSLALMVVCVVLSSTRGAWIGCFIGTLFLGVIGDRRILLFLLLAAVLFLLFAPGAQLRRALDTFDSSDATIRKRIYLWQSGLSIAKEDLLFGKGPGSYRLLYRDHLPEEAAEIVRSDHSHAHNIFIHTLAETGVIGLVSLVVLLGVAVRWIWKTHKRLSDPWSKAVVLGVLAGVVGFLIHGQVDYTLAGRTGFLFWFYLGLVYQCKALDKRKWVNSVLQQ